MTMTDPIIDRLDQIKGRADKATEGPWEWDSPEVSQHWSRPKPWCTVVSTEVACMAYCYGGTGRGVEREEDGEFIAHARTDVPQMEQALRAVLDLHKPVEVEPSDKVCGECSTLLPIGRFLRTFEWPCPTVRAVADALGFGAEGDKL